MSFSTPLVLHDLLVSFMMSTILHVNRPPRSLSSLKITLILHDTYRPARVLSSFKTTFILYDTARRPRYLSFFTPPPNLSSHALINAAIGFVLHTFVLMLFYAGRSTHRAPHKATNNLDRDETYLPPTRSDLQLPCVESASPADYMIALGEMPASTLCNLVVRQFLGFQLYLIAGPDTIVKEINDIFFMDEPLVRTLPTRAAFALSFSICFSTPSPKPGTSIVLSNAAIATMLFLLGLYAPRAGGSALAKFYLLLWLLLYSSISLWFYPVMVILHAQFVHDWIVTVRYLQHAAPTRGRRTSSLHRSSPTWPRLFHLPASILHHSHLAAACASVGMPRICRASSAATITTLAEHGDYLAQWRRRIWLIAAASNTFGCAYQCEPRSSQCNTLTVRVSTLLYPLRPLLVAPRFAIGDLRMPRQRVKSVRCTYSKSRTGVKPTFFEGKRSLSFGWLH
ncbi:hypothetical protein C8R43DRAFT_1142248 [Mycena crocata]|nr:hypothetical protein C8R43DRAFT_1142248 [Mycena crocata]